MKKNDDQRIKDTLAKNYACYVLITCDQPNEDGQMRVAMSYEGDPSVASYLLQGAQTFIDEQEFGKEEPCHSKILPFEAVGNS